MKIPCRMAPARVPPSSAASHLVMTAGWQLLKPLGNPGRPARHRCRFLATYVGADWSAGHTGAGADYHLAVIRNRRRLSPSSISISISRRRRADRGQPVWLSLALSTVAALADIGIELRKSLCSRLGLRLA